MTQVRIKNQESRIKLFISIISIALFFILTALFSFTHAYAQESTPDPSTGSTTLTTSPLRMGLPSNVSPTSPLYTDLLVHNMFHTFSCLGIGQSVIGQPCLNYIQGIPVLSSVNTSGGVLGTTTSLIGALYVNRPVRTADYLASVGQGLGIVKEANAQVVGSGAAVLNPILKLWKVSRNISYVFMIIIFVIIGLMVMFRTKINPQTVITAQAALPGLVIGLIMITFSYFLAGLITDTAFIGTNLVGYYFQAAQTGGNLGQNLTEVTTNQNALTLFSRLAGIIEINDISQAITVVFDNASGSVKDFLRFAASIAAFQIGSQVGHVVPVVGDIVAIVTGVAAVTATAAFTSPILGWVFSYIAMAALIYAMLKLLLKLVSNFLTIIFLTITAPFQFLAAALPGRQEIATNWILNMLANVLAFPAVMAVFYFVVFLVRRPPEIVSLFNITTTTSLVGNASLPLLGGLNLQFLQALLAFGALMATPAIPDIIGRIIGTLSQTGQLIGQEISGGISTGQRYSSQVQQQSFGAFGTIGQNYNTYRGKPMNWSPSGELRDEGISIFGKKIINPTEIKWLPTRTPPVVKP